jgi:hypothetical protein
LSPSCAAPEYQAPSQERKAIGSAWVFKLKRDASGAIIRFKVRWVARGDQAKEGLDYNETYAPTARMAHVRFALAIAARFDLDIHQLDVCTAFLGGILQEEIYMRPASRFGDALWGFASCSGKGPQVTPVAVWAEAVSACVVCYIGRFFEEQKDMFAAVWMAVFFWQSVEGCFACC